ncbi:hypothetical protein KBD11_00835 [Candidatus Saccharibacteria bacterium]|nr:hypothetical protein [Candidatus Saccharibacteria bacterium]
MASTKRFIEDRSALLLVSINTFLALMACVLVLLKINASKGTANYIISYRSSLGIDGYTQGTVWDIASFMVAALVLLFFGLTLSYRAYPIRRALSLGLLALTTFLMVLLIVVSNSLLTLR